MTSETEQPGDPASVALCLARALDERGTEYAIGGAIALGFWGRPRGTIDVDLNLFLPQDKPSEVIWELQQVGCDLSATSATQSLREHGFCSVQFASWPVDVFVSSNSFHDKAKSRRRRLYLGNDQVFVLDAETLAVFKMMFFREQDLIDIEQMLMVQGASFDRAWVREQVAEIFGQLDQRIKRWDELTSEIPA